MIPYSVGQTVEILLSQNRNSWAGPATVVRVDVDGLLVEIGKVDVWFPLARIVVPKVKDGTKESAP